jgi:uncharacterized protein YjlB
VEAGDAVLLPAGTGHRRIAASADFLVVGAYPPRQSFDIQRVAPGAAIQAAMARVAFPDSDPVEGADGALKRAWRRD